MIFIYSFTQYYDNNNYFIHHTMKTRINLHFPHNEKISQYTLYIPTIRATYIIYFFFHNETRAYIYRNERVREYKCLSPSALDREISGYRRRLRSSSRILINDVFMVMI